MVYQMGESRPKDAPFWFDPFVAYQLREEQNPVPIRPQAGKAIWREFAALFLPSSNAGGGHTKPPSALFQLANEGFGRDPVTYPFRCIGIRTDMKAKIFEWIDAGFDVPVDLINDAASSDEVHQEPANPHQHG